MPFAEVYRKQVIPELKEQLGRRPLIIETDLEGPQLIDDPLARQMKKSYGPPVTADFPYPGIVVYIETWNWYTAYTMPRRRTAERKRPEGLLPFLAQEGTDTSFILAPYLATGVTEQDLIEEHQGYRITPGAPMFNRHIKQENGLVFGITTALDLYEPITRKLGLDGLAGTQFPLEQTRERLYAEGKWDEEISMVCDYMQDCKVIVAHMYSEKTEEGKQFWRRKLHQRIEKFHIEELGISFDPTVRRQREKYKTIIGEAIEQMNVVGDRSKAAIAAYLTRNLATSDGLTVTIGDGPNDRALLQKGDLSIALNGGPYQYAKIVVVTPDVSNLIPIIDIARKKPHVLPAELVRDAKKELGDKAIICEGGSNVPQEIIIAGKVTKQQLRGEEGMLFV